MTRHLATLRRVITTTTRRPRHPLENTMRLCRRLRAPRCPVLADVGSGRAWILPLVAPVGGAVTHGGCTAPWGLTSTYPARFGNGDLQMERAGWPLTEWAELVTLVFRSCVTERASRRGRGFYPSPPGACPPDHREIGTPSGSFSDQDFDPT